MLKFLEEISKYKNNIAIIDNEEKTYDDLIKNISITLNKIKQLQIRENSIVAIKSDYSFQSICLFFALIEIKCIIVPITSRNSQEVESKIKISEVEYIIEFENENLKIEKTDLSSDQNNLLSAHISSDKSGLILFSSGTVGTPKAMLLDLDKILETTMPTPTVLRTIVFLMFDHIGGINTLLKILISGGSICIPKNRDVEHVLSLIEKYKIELLPTSPTFLNLIMLSDVHDIYNLTSLKYISYGTEPMQEKSLSKLNTIFPNVKFKQTYGLSELGIMSTKSKDSSSLFMKIGGDGFTVKIIENQLYIKSDTAMIGYLNANSPFDPDGFFPTGDLVEQDSEGYIKIIGRLKEFINVGGQKVMPSEVEGVLLELEFIRDVIVRKELNPITGEYVVTDVVVDNVQLDSEAKKILKKKIIEHCNLKLDSYKVPMKINFVENISFGERFKRKRM